MNKQFNQIDIINNIISIPAINSLQELIEMIVKDYNKNVYTLPEINSIHNYLYQKIINHKYLSFKKIKLIKLDLNKMIKFQNTILSFNENFKKEFKETITPQSDKNIFYKKLKETQEQLYNKNKYYKFYFEEYNINYYFYNDNITINLTDDYDDDLEINTCYKIDFNNNKIIISQNVTQNFIDKINNYLENTEFKFTLHKNNVIIGYKYN